jgi:L-asparaginase
MKIKIFTTGGSIDKYYSTKESDFIVGEPTISQILSEANVTVDYEIESLIKKDSLDLDDGDRKFIFEKVRSDPNRHIVITHGTDTIIQTAQVLTQITEKVIVLTGAMQPSAFKMSDAAFNIGGAILSVQMLPSGVYISMNGRILNPQKAIKNLELDRFEIA